MEYCNEVKFDDFDISDVFSQSVTEKRFEFTLCKDELPVGATVTVCDGLSVSGRVFSEAKTKNEREGLVRLEMKLYAKMTDLCARCLEKVEFDFSHTLCETVVLSLAGKDEDEYILAPQKHIDLCDIAVSAFFLELPTRTLCREDCRGICQGCGANLNFEECGCKEKEVDPRLSKLRELLDK